MAEKCLDKILLQYSGTSQVQRILKALQSDYAKVDERNTADLILFIKKYSAYLNYYKTSTNAVNGTWEDFMSKDVAVTIATIASIRTKDFIPFLNNINDELQGATTDANAAKFFKPLFDLVFTLATQLDQNLQKLPVADNFTKFLSVAITSNLALPLNILFQYYTRFNTASLIDTASTYIDPLMPVDDVVFAQDFHYSNLSPVWTITNPPNAPEISLSASVSSNIKHIATHNLFTGPLQSFVNAVISLVGKTPAYLDEALKNYPTHQPHYALFLAFLRLFRFAQNHLNGFTQNHLDFYYKDVLRLSNRAAEPDFVHLIFELQKNSAAHLLAKGTQFKAGKDAKNNDIFYALTDNVVVQKATVQALKSIFLDKIKTKTLFASPVANSDDGQEAKLTSADKSWFAFGDAKKIKQANIGFAIASNMLFLNEGKRTITISFQCNALTGITTADLSEAFAIQLTGKKSLYTVETYTPSISGSSFSLDVTLGGDVPAIIPYSQKTHGGNFTTTSPMMQVMVADYKSYQKIKSVRITSITITVKANVKNLSLQNDDGKINPAKPFKPFGEFPESGAAFIIGSKEIFQKPLTALTINPTWQLAPPTGTNGDAVALKEGDWSNIVFDTSINLNSNSFGLDGLTNLPQSEPDFSDNEEYKITTVDGFIKLRYNSNANSISTYLTGVSAAISNTGASFQRDDKNNIINFTLNMPAVQSPPKPPVAKSISIDYTASVTMFFNETADNFEERKNFFYHIEPFGFREIHPDLTSDARTLLPVFNLDDGQPNDNGGELWIGLKDALPAQTFSILFQVAEGSANPLKTMTTVNWYYLANNNWEPFDHLAVTDQTNNLTRSGIVIVNIPNDATLNNSRADAGLLWIKAVVDHDTDAVCKLIDVRTNAGKATFVQDLTKGIEFIKPLPPSTISKLVVADGAIKKIDQPYASFGGRIKETNNQFYVRVSERLRHKHRAITTWDYERLVLQYFPQIHKAKCLNHTGFYINEKNNQQEYAETLPGHVMVVPIPDLTNQLNTNLLRPYTSVGLLTEIQQYLAKLDSPFVELHVTNPQFEEVQFDFEVTFYENFDPTYYTNALNLTIEQFLTPWAYSTGKDIEFGGKIEKSVVLNFVEEQPYVDFVTCFKMNHIIRRDGNTIQEAKYDIEEAFATTARSILVSYYNEETQQRHIIQSPANCNCNV